MSESATNPILYRRGQEMLSSLDLLVTGGEVVSGDGSRKADVAIHDGVIVEVGLDLSSRNATSRIDATGRYVLPGLFDAHNHPYYDDNLEHFSRAAAYGGITTLIPFVTNRPMGKSGSMDIVHAMKEFVDEVESSSYLDCSGHAILSPDDDFADVIPRLRDLGTNSFKVFLAFPGIRMLTDDQVYRAMTEIAKAGGICMVHCENGPVTELLERQFRQHGQNGGAEYLASRPAPLEAESVYRSLSLAAVAKCPAYIVHISAEESMRIIDDFRRRGGPPIYAETCLHYLCLTGQDQIDLGPRAKISPPFRTEDDREGLWERITSKQIDVIATDASGQLLENKEVVGTDYLSAPYGIPGVEEFVRVLTKAASERGIDPLPVIARTMAERPARIFGLEASKGSIEVGKNADLAIFDPEQPWQIRAEQLHGRSNYSLYEGTFGTGCITWTCQRGNVILANDTLLPAPGGAKFLPSEVRSKESD